MAGRSGPASLRGRARLRNPVHLLALGFGTGLAPRAPGTVGTLPAIPLYLLLTILPGWVALALIAVAVAGGVWICDQAARDFGVHDHPAIVWDEIAGFLVALAIAPAGWAWLAAAFVLFRLLDALKPWPIGLLDRRVGGGLGIMLDDVAAGLATGVVLQLLLWLAPA